MNSQNQNKKESRNLVYAFIDASNLFYGGKKSLGWKIDYRKLLIYLRNKYKISKALYFGGVEIYDFKFNYLKNETVPIGELEKHLAKKIKERGSEISDANLLLLDRHL
ncbi:MAG: hypothetical protein J7K20_04875 [Thermodesulfobacterium sp.]|nr:hypothetical protein [Thermodesulfobacterium sp.]